VCVCVREGGDNYRDGERGIKGKRMEIGLEIEKGKKDNKGNKNERERERERERE
jgi:hypothetical protein